jgi:AraC-like DNA-binding protein
MESASHSPGRECALARLSELMFVEAMRRYVSTLPEERRGWLAALSDDLVGRALAALHARPNHAWTIELLAKESATSRSVLAERFSDVVGLPPMQYLAQWRMQLAAELLSGTSAGLSEVAARIGYGSESAFSHAFKRLVGVSPARFREGERPAHAVEPSAELAGASGET